MTSIHGRNIVDLIKYLNLSEMFLTYKVVGGTERYRDITSIHLQLYRGNKNNKRKINYLFKNYYSKNKHTL